MAEPISLIMADASQNDAESVVHILESEGYVLNWERVDTGAGLREALGSQTWDIAITELSIPSLSAAQVLAMTREMHPGLPVILLSSSHDMSQVVTCLKAGARDYVSKSELVLLPWAVARVLENSRRNCDKMDSAMASLTAAQAELESQYKTLKLQKKALSASERRLAEILDFLPDATFVIDLHGRVILWNRAMEKMTGLSKEKMIGSGNYEYSLSFYSERRPILIDLALRPSYDYEDVVSEYDLLRWEGDTLVGELYVPGAYQGKGAYLLGSASRLYDMKGYPAGAIQSIRDVSQRKSHERTLARWASIFESADWGIAVCDPENFHVELANPAFARMHDCRMDAVINRSVLELYPADKQALILEQIYRAKEQGHSFLEIQINGTSEGAPSFTAGIDITAIRNDNSETAYLIGSMQDITDRRRLEEMMVQTEKIMSIGGLAAGMAHEINNPLGGMLQGAQNVLRRLSMDISRNKAVAQKLGIKPEAIQAYVKERQIVEILDNMQHAGVRAASIISNMLEFSRRGRSQKVPVKLAELVDKTLSLAANDFDLEKDFDFRRIKVVREYSPDVPDICCVPIEIEQVVLNLFKNAAHAMFEHGVKGAPPQLTVRISPGEKSAIVEVEDNGPGLDENLKKRVFEPFFTTKRAGSGTGLGLSVARFIVNDNHGGDLLVHSTPGQGARFTMVLPLNGRHFASGQGDAAGYQKPLPGIPALT